MKYEKLINRIKKAYLYAQTDSTKAVLEEILPELKESEDERIREELIAYHRSMAAAMNGNRPCVHEAWIAWLEKLGEQKPIDKIQLGKKFKCIASPRYSTFMIGEIYKPEDKFLCSLMNFCYGCFEPIEDGEQKPADKVEPKFKVGDWITNSIETVQITGYDIDYGYQVDYKGNLQHRDTNIIEKEYHLWTIQDAKDGDVLACGDKVTDCPFIFHNLTKELNPRSYCGFNTSCCFQYNDENGGFWCDSDEVRPATKEQCDFLFSKMKEAGYEWDAEKKELKKHSNLESIGEKWSEEDKKKLNRIYRLIAEAADEHAFFTTCRLIGDKECVELQDFLKSLKPQPKQEWSEEDEFCLNTILNILEQLKGQSPYGEDDTAEKCINFLKSKLKK